MTVRELLTQLADVDPNRTVVMSRDAEGNGYSPLASIWEGAYRADTTWSGEVGMESLTEDDRSRGYTEDDLILNGVPALILAPTN